MTIAPPKFMKKIKMVHTEHGDPISQLNSAPESEFWDTLKIKTRIGLSQIYTS